MNMTKRPKYRLLIRQQGGEVIDTYESFNVACQEFPFRHLPETKDLPKRDWYDEHGEDSFIPTDGLKFKAYDLEAKFIYVGEEADMTADVKRFINYLYGRNDGGSPILSVYDEYTKTGRTGVYMVGVTTKLFDISSFDLDAIAIFSAKFRVTDPVTDIVLGMGVS